jgi:hypothetical protein
MLKGIRGSAVLRAAHATIDRLRSWSSAATPLVRAPSGTLLIERLESRLFLSASSPAGTLRTVGESSQAFIYGSGQLPDLPLPSFLPPLPTGINTFKPPVDADVLASGGPVIASYDLSGEPNDSIAVTGSGFSAAGSQFVVYGQTTSSNGKLLDAQIQEASTDGDILTISPSEPAGSMYLIWPVSSTGVVGTPVAVNQTDPTWFAATPTFTSTIPVTVDDAAENMVYASPSQTISVYGQNLSNGSEKSWIYLEPTSGGAGTAIAVTWKNVNNYQVQFTLPSTLAAGSYQVWINNGLGGQYGWSQAPGTLTVQAVTPWPTASKGAAGGFFNVTSYGATANGSDAGPGILLAIAAAQAYQALNPGALVTLYFPAGTYTISGGEQITLPSNYASGNAITSNVQVLGASSKTTNLVFTHAPLDNGYGRYLIGSEDEHGFNIAFDALTISYTGPETTSGTPIELIRERSGANLTFDSVVLDADAAACAIDWDNSTDATIEASQIVGGGANSSSPILLFGASDVLIDHVGFLYMYNPQAAITAGDTSDACITNCTAQDFDDAVNSLGVPLNPDGWGDGRLLENAASFGPIQNEYVAYNTTIALAALPGDTIDHNTGEQINNEGCTDLSNSNALASGSNWVEIAYASAVAVGQNVIITDGTGTGQLRTITAITDVTVGGVSALQLTLNQPWTLAPDTTSRIEVTNDISNSIFFQNTLQDKTGPNGAIDPTVGGPAGLQAAAGFEVFSGGYGLVFDSNTVDNVLDGVSLWNAGIDNPCFFIEVLNNKLNNTEVGILYAPQQNTTTQDFIGVVVRGNTINGSNPNSSDPPLSGSGIILAETSHDFTDYTGSACLSIIEHNSIDNAPVGLTAYDDPTVFVYENAFDAGTYSGATSTGILYANGIQAILINSNTFQKITKDYVTAQAVSGNPHPRYGRPLLRLPE